MSWFPWIVIVPEHHRVAVFRLGKLKGVRGPGVVWRSPMFDKLYWVDMRTHATSVPSQQCMTRDSVPVYVRAVVFFKVTAPERAVVEVGDYVRATLEVGIAAVRDVCGQVDFQSLLSDRELVEGRLFGVVNQAAQEWGVEVSRVALKDIRVSAELRDSLSQEAAAERARRAAMHRATGEREAAAQLAEATRILDEAKYGLAMRYLQVLMQTSNDGNPIVFSPTFHSGDMSGE